MTTLQLLVLKVQEQSSLVPSMLFVDTSLKTTLTAVAAGQSASGSSGVESFEDMWALVLGMSAIDKQVTPCHQQSVLTLMMDRWPGQGSWEMEFECQNLQSWTEMAKVARTCMWGWGSDWCFRQLVEAPAAARRGQFLPVVSFSYSLK